MRASCCPIPPSTVAGSLTIVKLCGVAVPPSFQTMFPVDMLTRYTPVYRSEVMKSPPTACAELRCQTSCGASQVDVAARAQMLGLISVGERWSLANQRD